MGSHPPKAPPVRSSLKMITRLAADASDDDANKKKREKKKTRKRGKDTGA